MASLVNTSQATFDDVLSTLLSLRPPLLPPGKATDPTLTDKIASLYVHPCLEAALHLLNADLPSAHFLCRHMQAAPQFEGMFLHGILHRIEGDYDNARAWYKDVAESDVFKHVWPVDSNAFKLIDQVQALNAQGKAKSEKADLEQRSVAEIQAVIDFCREKFGTAQVQDASTSWQQPGGEHKKLGQEMVSGDKGFRTF